MRRLQPGAFLLTFALAACGTADPGRVPSGDQGAGVRRSIALEVQPGEQPIRIENLAGSLTVVPGAGEKIRAVATIHAASDELAGLVTFEEARGEEETTLLRVGYPIAEHITYRYGEPGETGSNWLNLFGAGGSNTGFPYGGTQVRVSRSRGAPLWVDLEVSLPAADVSVSFLNGVGPVHARGVRGNLKFTSYSGSQDFEDLTGHLTAEMSSGAVAISRHHGSLTCESASGRILIQDFDGGDLACTALSGDLVVTGAASETIRLETASGDISLEKASARLLKAATASGDIDVGGARVEEFEAGTASGDVAFSAEGEGLRKIEVSTASGDVTLQLDPASTFEARADLAHGRIENGFEDAEAIREGETLLGYRRGDARIRIDVRTVHGDLKLSPRR